MKAIYRINIKVFFMVAATFLQLSVVAQKFPLGIEPLSNPGILRFKHPIKYMSTENFLGKVTSTYKYESYVELNGIGFSILFLYFQDDKLTTMNFGVKNKSDFAAIVKSLNAKYKRHNNCLADFCYRNGNISITISKSPEPRNEWTEYGYLTYTYELSGEL